MNFPPSFLDAIRQRMSASSVIGKAIKLTPKGRGEFSALCPFHREKSPSFTVSDDKGFYHCFGCGAHGDVIGFMMNYHRLEFPEAVKQLAEEAGLPMPEPETPVQKAQRERSDILREAVEFAAAWFEEQLRLPAGQEAQQYLIRRGLGEDVIREFRLGYAPDSRHGLKDYLARKGVLPEIMLEAGLTIQPENGDAYDRFRGRVIFPIQDAKGRVVAFGGRALGAEQQPKYLNSPETPLFHKGHMLYNFHRARAAAKDDGRYFIVEGYMDVIAFHRAGIHTAVAPLGTAFTPDQLQLLWPLVAEPTLCLDGDAAGQRAMHRAAQTALPLLKPGHSLNFVLLPAGKDPDDIVSTGGAGALKEAVAQPQPLSEIIWRFEAGNAELTTPEKRAALEQRVNEVVQSIADKTVRGHYQQFMNDRLWEMKRRTGGSKKFSPQPARKAAPTPSAIAVNPVIRLEQEMLLLLIASPDLLLEGEVEEAFTLLEWHSPEHQPLAEGLRNILEGKDFLAISPEERAIVASTLRPELESAGFEAALRRLGNQSFVDKSGDSGANSKAHAVSLATWRYLTAARSVEIIRSEYEAVVREWWESDPEKVEAFRRQKEQMESTAVQSRQSLETMLEQ